jgi:hypothetical protein
MQPCHQAIDCKSFVQPTLEQSVIFTTIRTLKEREIASTLFNSRRRLLPWLRTSYSEGINPLQLLDDESIAGTMSRDGECDLVLDDKDKHNYGTNWKQILSLIPKIVASVSYKDPTLLSHSILEAKEIVVEELEYADDEEMKDDIRESVQRCMGHWMFVSSR